MASTSTTSKGNPIPQGDHDRVVMLSLRADGTPDQTNPEIIGDKEFAVAAAKEQFAQRAVAAVDAAKRAELGLAGSPAGGDTSDAAIDALKAEHEKAAAAAESAAEALVDQLYQGDTATTAAPPASTGKASTAK